MKSECIKFKNILTFNFTVFEIVYVGQVDCLYNTSFKTDPQKSFTFNLQCKNVLVTFSCTKSMMSCLTFSVCTKELKKYIVKRARKCCIAL